MRISTQSALKGGGKAQGRKMYALLTLSCGVPAWLGELHLPESPSGGPGQGSVVLGGTRGSHVSRGGRCGDKIPFLYINTVQP